MVIMEMSLNPWLSLESHQTLDLLSKISGRVGADVLDSIPLHASDFG